MNGVKYGHSCLTLLIMLWIYKNRETQSETSFIHSWRIYSMELNAIIRTGYLIPPRSPEYRICYKTRVTCVWINGTLASGGVWVRHSMRTTEWWILRDTEMTSNEPVWEFRQPQKTKHNVNTRCVLLSWSSLLWLLEKKWIFNRQRLVPNNNKLLGKSHNLGKRSIYNIYVPRISI